MLTQLRQYNPETDRYLIRDAINEVGLAGGFLSNIARTLTKNGIQWSHGNKEIERDILEYIKELNQQLSRR